VATINDKTIYLHFLQKSENNFILLPGFTENIVSVEVMNTGQKLKWNEMLKVFLFIWNTRFRKWLTL
jgi:hypothetical protein